MAEIGNPYEFLSALTDGLPPVPKRYELRCHPDVYYLALRMASDDRAQDWTPSADVLPGARGLYGSADITVRPELGSGGWELYENGELLKSGRLGEGGDDD